GHFLLALPPRLYLALLALHGLRPLSERCLATAILVQFHDTSQIRLGESLQLLRQTPGSFLQGGMSGLTFLGQPGTAASSSQRLFDPARLAEQFTDILPDDFVELRRRNEAGRAALISSGLRRCPFAATNRVTIRSLRAASTGESAHATAEQGAYQIRMGRIVPPGKAPVVGELGLDGVEVVLAA